MMSFAPLLILLGPLALVAATAGSSAIVNADAGDMARRSLLAAFVALGAAIVGAVCVIWAGPLATPTIGVFGAGLGVHLDALSAVMFVLVAFLGVVVLRYSRNYMDGDARQGDFLKWLSVTLAAVLVLIVSGNLAQFLAAWIATSLGLGKLLLFYPERQAAQLAARKEFLASRLGDLCLVGVVVLCLAAFGTLEFGKIFDTARTMAAEGRSSGLITVAALLIVIAALLKSAQLPFHGWLTEVMETPTPVSALLHAGIINAGGFLVLRMSDLLVLGAGALPLLAIVGGATALFASVVMLTQTSVKVSLAWSTIAQMGFMLLQCGLGAFSAALLHIVAHSLYKAHAFLSSGSVIDLARSSWSPSPGGQPHPARIVIALLAVFAVTLGVGALFGATLDQKPGAFTLAAILLMGLTHLIANAIDERPNSFVVLRVAALALGVAVAYFALQAVAEWLMAGTMPPTMPASGALDLALAGLVILSFSAVTIFQSVMALRAGSPAWLALHTHLANGLYLNTMANRLVLQLWPPAAAPASSSATVNTKA
jgi:NAD(P)H-quinone oxidoreductase subunit 5